MDELISKLIAKHISSVTTIKTQFSDSLDFHDIHIGLLVDLTREAIETGTEIGINAATALIPN